MNPMHALAPIIKVEYWRNNPPGGISAVRSADEAHFAVLSVQNNGVKSATRFDLPAMAHQLAVALAACHVAYRFGHYKRTNIVRSALGLDPVDGGLADD